MSPHARRTRVKFCGMTTPDDVALAVAAGADAVGVILAPSERRVALGAFEALGRAIPPYVARVGVVVAPSDDEARALRSLGFTLQYSGEEPADDCERQSAGVPYVKAYHLRPGAATPPDPDVLRAYAGALWMFDTRVGDRLGGTGVAFAWDLVAPLARRRSIVVSGGLTPDNVGACVRAVRPFAVDVRGGIERDGVKDARLMAAFVRAVREADGAAP